MLRIVTLTGLASPIEILAGTVWLMNWASFSRLGRTQRPPGDVTPFAGPCLDQQAAIDQALPVIGLVKVGNPPTKPLAVA